MDLRKAEWTVAQLRFAKQGIALCRRNYNTVRGALTRAATHDETLTYAERRTLRHVLHREFTGDKRFPMWVNVYRDEHPVLSKALRGGESPTAAYNLYLKCIRQGELI
jgi:hypothetical protein